MGPDTAGVTIVMPELRVPGCFTFPDILPSLPAWWVEFLLSFRHSLFARIVAMVVSGIFHTIFYLT